MRVMDKRRGTYHPGASLLNLKLFRNPKIDTVFALFGLDKNQVICYNTLGRINYVSTAIAFSGAG